MTEPESVPAPSGESAPSPDGAGTDSPASETAAPSVAAPAAADAAPQTGYPPAGFPPSDLPSPSFASPGFASPGFAPPGFLRPAFPPPGYPPSYPAGTYPPGFPPAAYPPGFPPPGISQQAYLPPGFPPPGYGFAPPAPPVAPGGVPLAEIWERLVAYIIDYALLCVIGFIPGGIVLAVIWSRLINAFDRISRANQQAIDNGTTLHPFSGMGQFLQLEGIAFAILLPTLLILSYLYMVTFMHRSGQTLGKRIMKIRVVRAADGTPITLPMARKRWLVAFPAAFVAPYFSYADSLWLLWDKPYRQCLHDKCAETVVVKIKP
jgi:uncharacterized RDD family membrane protein YckC